MTDQPDDYRGAEAGGDSHNVSRLAQMLDQTKISDRTRFHEHPRTPDIAPEAYEEEGGFSPDHVGSYDGNYVHGGPSSYGAYQNHDGGVPAQEYDDGEFPQEYDGRDYPEDYVGDQYEQDYYEDEEYAYADDIQEEVPPGPVNPQTWDPSFHLDPMYQIHDDKDWVVGSIVKLYWAEPKGHTTPKAKHGATTLFTLADMAYQSIRRMVVVSTTNGSSFCCPISTYGGQGCNKRRCKPEKHGIIYDAREEPQTLKDEKRLGIPPVGAQMYDDHTLSIASRLNYGNGHTVQHNLPVVFIGRIPTKAMKLVKSTCKGFLLEASDEDVDKPKSPKPPRKPKSNRVAINGDWNQNKKDKKYDKKDGGRDKKDGERSKTRHSRH